MRTAKTSADGSVYVLDGRIAYLQSWEDKPSGEQVCVISSLRLDRLDIAAEPRVPGYCDIISTPAS